MKTMTCYFLLFTMAITGIALAEEEAQDPAADSKRTTEEASQSIEEATSHHFTLIDAAGKTHTLSSYQGQYVVLEWVNFDCPFVKKHYRSGNMPRLQETYTAKGVVWLAICSSAPNKQGYYEGDALTDRIEQENFKGSAYLLDSDGAVGKQYHAKTTPHLFILSPKLKLIYSGAIDSTRSTDPDDIDQSTNYVAEVLEAAMADLPIPHAITAPYGCSVKY